MIKILNAQQIKAWDAATLLEEPIAPLDLMERASRAFVDWLVVRYDATQPVLVVCGTGNNGGDGLAIARMLYEWSYRVRVWIVRGTPESADFLANLARLPQGVERTEAVDAFPPVAPAKIVIDALFGSGLSRPLSGIHESVVASLNQADAVRLAVDVPSGLQLDAPSAGTIFRADHTVTFQAPKLPFFFPEAAPYVGQWHVAEIGLSKSHIRQVEVPCFYVTKRAVRKLIRVRSRFSHKGTYGHAHVVAGSTGKMGACVLATRAALRVGAGLVTAHVPGKGNIIVQTQVPEAMTSPDLADDYLTDVRNLTSATAVGIGPGLGQAPATVHVLEQVLRVGKPLVLDADALNLLASHRNLLQEVPPLSVLTPHPREFERLAGPSQNSFERVSRQQTFARQLQSVVVVKGAYTSIATPDGKLYFNSTGNPGMATGGTGDVLTGMLAGLLAQGYPANEAALLGVYWHGLAGDLAADDLGDYPLIASDLINYLPQAFQKLTE